MKQHRKIVILFFIVDVISPIFFFFFHSARRHWNRFLLFLNWFCSPFLCSLVDH
jgi:hypothetical protein